MFLPRTAARHPAESVTCAAAGAETLFQPDELQRLGAARWQAARDAFWALWTRCPPARASSIRHGELPP
ncbi:MAG TPA: hypothetical protein VF040_10430 [Ktedonobacterales bacterium]